MNDRLFTKTINISPSASAKGIREMLESEAVARGMKVTTIVSAIYTYAVDHRDMFSTPIQSPRKKGGEHIGAKVSEDTAKALQKWANDTNRSRGYLCCYILEKMFEAGILEEVVNDSNLYTND